MQLKRIPLWVFPMCTVTRRLCKSQAFSMLVLQSYKTNMILTICPIAAQKVKESLCGHFLCSLLQVDFVNHKHFQSWFWKAVKPTWFSQIAQQQSKKWKNPSVGIFTQWQWRIPYLSWPDSDKSHQKQQDIGNEEKYTQYLLSPYTLLPPLGFFWNWRYHFRGRGWQFHGLLWSSAGKEDRRA